MSESKNKSEYHAIGDVFEYEGEQYVVEKDPSRYCIGCDFLNNIGECKRPLIVCEDFMREDNTSVIFKSIKMEEVEIKDHPIGSIIKVNNQYLRVDESPIYYCKGCYFSKNANINCDNLSALYKIGYCNARSRSDQKEIIYTPVEVITSRRYKWQVINSIIQSIIIIILSLIIIFS